MTDLIKGSVWPWKKTDLIARLLAEETDLTDCAADCIDRLKRERDAALAAQDYTYIGKDMKPILARDLEDAKDEALAKLAKATAYLQKISRHANRSCSAIAARALAELEK